VAVRNIRRVKAFAWVPPNTSAEFNFELIKKDGTIVDFTDRWEAVQIMDGVTEGIGTFKLKIPDPNEEFHNAFLGGEQFLYRSDYATSATTLRFKGRIEKVGHQNNTFMASGRSEALFVADVTVTQTFEGQDAADIVRSLFSIYGEGRFTTTNVEASTGQTLNLAFRQKPFWKCIEEICLAVDRSCYVDATDDVHFFEKGTQINNDESIIHEFNLLDQSDFSDDLAQVRNRIVFYGANIDGGQILYTAEDKDSIAEFGVKEEIINDQNVSTFNEAQENAESILAFKKDPPKVGDVKSILLATVRPGDSFYISNPSGNLPPARYNTISYEHDFSQDLLSTKVTIERKSRQLSQLLKRRVETENDLQNASENPHELRFSRVVTYVNEDTASETNVEQVNGVLKLVSAGSGVWLSGSRILPANLNNVFVRTFGDALTGVTVEVSGNGGVTFQEIAADTLANISEATGTNLVIQVTLDDLATQLDTLTLFYDLIDT